MRDYEPEEGASWWATSQEAWENVHFHGCPTPTGRPFDCDYCQDRARSMSGE